MTDISRVSSVLYETLDSVDPEIKKDAIIAWYEAKRLLDNEPNKTNEETVIYAMILPVIEIMFMAGYICRAKENLGK